MDSDTIYSHILDTQDSLKKTKTSKNLSIAAATICTVASISTISLVGQNNILTVAACTGAFVTGAAISFYKLNKRLEDIKQYKLQLINLRREYEHQKLIESQVYPSRLRYRRSRAK